MFRSTLKLRCNLVLQPDAKTWHFRLYPITRNKLHFWVSNSQSDPVFWIWASNSKCFPCPYHALLKEQTTPHPLLTVPHLPWQAPRVGITGWPGCPQQQQHSPCVCRHCSRPWFSCVPLVWPAQLSDITSYVCSHRGRVCSLAHTQGEAPRDCHDFQKANLKQSWVGGTSNTEPPPVISLTCNPHRHPHPHPTAYVWLCLTALTLPSTRRHRQDSLFLERDLRMPSSSTEEEEGRGKNSSTTTDVDIASDLY